MADSKEAAFQQDIINAMAAQGWLVGTAAGYDPATALYTEDLLGYFQTAWGDRWDKLCTKHPHDPAQHLITQTVRQLGKTGTLDVLRKGFKITGIPIQLCSFQPDHGMNPDTQARYRANRLRVVPEVSYSPHARPGEYNPRLDLVLFVNGIPTATLELKSNFKQPIDNAIRQYRRDRPPKAPTTRKPEPLLTFKRGALVHFVATQDAVAMTTQLAGPDTPFLPFNQGTPDGGAGNPPAPNENTYATAYLWQDLFQPDAWLKAIGRFLHLQTTPEAGFDGSRRKPEKLIFPRYHQWQAVNRLIAATRRDGPGQRYLIQHSAGSGKSNSIAWTAHQLSALYDDSGQKLFNSVIVVTDRTVLDSQLQATVKQFETTEGLVLPITRDNTPQSKSEQLADALASKTRIIIVTIQTFPALFDALDKYPALASGRYAVIADEAHSSQTGAAANKLKAILLRENPDREETSSEDMIRAAVQARGPSDRISYYAFTATPKAKTLELFGRRPRPTLPPNDDDNKPEPFHLYSMRQAIEEGFILDVLRHYTPYSTAWKIAHPQSEGEIVDAKKARTTLARWVRLHPYNISQKVEIIVEHFRKNVRHLLNGQAKAMVVTSSRQEAVRYHLALNAYIKDKGYTDVHALVAFSGKVPADAMIAAEVTETSAYLNPDLRGRDLRDAFDTPEFNLMIVANKFQTGFDQPKLCAMYVDKKLHGVDCVQTFSRLNRIFPGKVTFILDFFNDPQDILAAFLPYYNKAELERVSDAQIVYDLQRQLDDEDIYRWSEVAALAQAFFDPKAAHSKLNYHCNPAVDRYKQRYKAAEAQRRQALHQKQAAPASGNPVALKSIDQAIQAAGEAIDRLDLFKKNLQSFIRLYEFLSQIVDYEDPELEQLCVYARHLHPLLRRDRLDEERIDVAELQLTHYRLTKRAEQHLRLAENQGDYPLKPPSDVGSGNAHDPEKKQLSEIIQALNDLFGAEVSDADQLRFLEAISDRLRQQDDVMAQIKNHPPEQVMHGLYPQRVVDTVLDAMTDYEKMSLSVLDNEASSQRFARLVLRILTAALPPRSNADRGVG